MEMSALVGMTSLSTPRLAKTVTFLVQETAALRVVGHSAIKQLLERVARDSQACLGALVLHARTRSTAQEKDYKKRQIPFNERNFLLILCQA
eukprot:scaffold55844_cov38-Tisochrysis_lutea.AAC.1